MDGGWWMGCRMWKRKGETFEAGRASRKVRWKVWKVMAVGKEGIVCRAGG